MPQSVRAVVVDPSRSDKLTLQTGRDAARRARRRHRPRHGDLAQPRRGQSRAVAVRRRRAPRLGLRRRHRGSRRGRAAARRSARAWSACCRPAPGRNACARRAMRSPRCRTRVTDAQAATLPVAGLTALHALRQGGLLLGRKVLVDGATGGVGHLAVQLAATAGAEVYGHVRRAEQAAMIREWCGDRVIVAADLRAAASSGPYHLILDSIGGSALSAALTMLQPNGTCVHFRRLRGADDDIRERRVLPPGRREAVRPDPVPRTAPGGAGRPGPGRAGARGRAAAGCARTSRSRRHGPTSPAIARRLIAREFVGKAVLHVG